MMTLSRPPTKGVEPVLVLARNLGESVLLMPPGQPPIRVTFVWTNGDKIRLGFQAERDVTILRSELVGEDASKFSR